MVLSLTTSETLLKFSLYDFNDYDNLAHLQIPTADYLEQGVIELGIILKLLENAVNNFFHWRLSAGRLFIEIP